jgi:hypothetical protein
VDRTALYAKSKLAYSYLGSFRLLIILKPHFDGRSNYELITTKVGVRSALATEGKLINYRLLPKEPKEFTQTAEMITSFSIRQVLSAKIVQKLKIGFNHSASSWTKGSKTSTTSYLNSTTRATNLSESCSAKNSLRRSKRLESCQRKRKIGLWISVEQISTVPPGDIFHKRWCRQLTCEFRTLHSKILGVPLTG